MANSLLDQINAELTLILTKLGGSAVPNIGAQVATLVTNVATSKAVADTLAAQVVTSATVIDTLTTNIALTTTAVDTLADTDDTGTGLGDGSAADITQDLVALIAQEP